MAIYNTSWMENVTSPTDLIVNIGSVMNDQFLIGHLILFSFWIVLVITNDFRNDLRASLMISSFLTSILSLLLYGAGNLLSYPLIPITTFVYPFVIFLLSALSYLITR